MDATAAVPCLPNDIIIEIFNVVDWQTILSIRRVSILWYELSKTWSIWATLVLRETLHKPDGPTLCHLEKPLKDYTAPALAAVFKRWKTAERVLQAGVREPPLVKSFAVPASRGPIQRQLLPGGRWLLVLDGASASYIDLDATTPSAHTLFTNHFLDSPLALSKIRVGPLCLQHDLNSDVRWQDTGYKIFMALSFADERISAWVVQVWEIQLVHDEGISHSRLDSTLRTTMKFRLDVDRGYVICRSLTTDLLALPIMEDENGTEPCISLVDWQTLDVDAGFQFKRATTHHIVDQGHLVLVPRQPRLLVLTNQSVFLYDYSRVRHRHGHPTQADALADEHNLRRHLLLSNSNYSNSSSIMQTFSDPYIFFRDLGSQTSSITIRLVSHDEDNGRLLGVEVEIALADSDDGETKFAARYVHLGALPVMVVGERILLCHGQATTLYRDIRNAPPGIQLFFWASDWKVGDHDGQVCKAFVTLPDGRQKLGYAIVDMDEGTARHIVSTEFPSPMLYVIDFAA